MLYFTTKQGGLIDNSAYHIQQHQRPLWKNVEVYFSFLQVGDVLLTDQFTGCSFLCSMRAYIMLAGNLFRKAM